MCEFKIAYQKLTKLVLYQIIRTELKAYNNTRRYSHNFGLTQNLPIYTYEVHVDYKINEDIQRPAWSNHLH